MSRWGALDARGDVSTLHARGKDAPGKIGRGTRVSGVMLPMTHDTPLCCAGPPAGKGSLPRSLRASEAISATDEWAHRLPSWHWEKLNPTSNASTATGDRIYLSHSTGM